MLNRTPSLYSYCKKSILALNFTFVSISQARTIYWADHSINLSLQLFLFSLPFFLLLLLFFSSFLLLFSFTLSSFLLLLLFFFSFHFCLHSFKLLKLFIKQSKLVIKYHVLFRCQYLLSPSVLFGTRPSSSYRFFLSILLSSCRMILSFFSFTLACGTFNLEPIIGKEGRDEFY